MDIRWQSDREHHVGQRYYVYSDGRAEPFLEDRTGTMSYLQMVVENTV
eukprot:CAMPEP_0176474782 /NCGR_PEP_ID=MMETSP0127-20121128/43226_1 /TAXON_ID=938130 /ORGANISM="Platyophrya macrostoma, Strain WH" /LENGTH=47 /DNA_ID= /DNA_START= /DNA_END= /DNA_ORIENTATION=